MGKTRALIIDDELVIREGLKRILEEESFVVESCASGYHAVEMLQQSDFDIIITDLKMPGMSGMEVLKSVRTLQPDIPVILITGYASVDTAVEAMKNGASDYITKPFVPNLLLEKVKNALAQRTISLDEISFREDVALSQGFHQFIGESREMQKVYHRIRHVAGTNSTVLITGESGTGKELAARAIHDNSLRKNSPFVAVDCSSLAETLLESELFGHVKGSFTGAVQSKTGLFKIADGGTLFLDEVSNISLSTQAKLLRALQERKITPIGGTQLIPIDIHLVAATNKNLKLMSKEGTFREDLFFRLNIIPIELPPLRERRQDIPVLISHFLKKYTLEIGKEIKAIEPDVMIFLENYAYPGNVRELENMIERAVVLAEGDVIRNEDLELWESSESSQVSMIERIPMNVEELKEMKRNIRDHAMESLEGLFVRNALERNGWNVTKAAEETGILRPNFQSMMKKLGISVKGEH
ncbi:MAG: sigma-54 dependent transcriptional regulator [Desulfuromonadaceae bacterium]|nr:sigma-54 dependent transcriptional regulator [Desulfuromonadaceae bacterium]MDD2855572.1 sigma-54 dependent transcriptional regulator [Desulfuromonadaceae bacterium]